MYFAAKFFFPCDELEFGFPADQVVRIVGYPDGSDGVLGDFMEKFTFGEMGEFAEEGGDFSIFKGGDQLAGMGQIGGVDVAMTFVIEDDAVTIKTGIGVGTFEVAGEAGEVLGGEGGEGERAMDVRFPGLDFVPVDGEADEFGEEETFFEPFFHVAHDLRWAEDVEGSSPRAEPE